MQIIAIVTLFLMGWTSYLSRGVYEIVTGTTVHLHFEFAAEVFVTINDLLNPVVVMVFDDNMRRNVLRFFARAWEHAVVSNTFTGNLAIARWTPFLAATVYEIITGTKAYPDFEFAGELFVPLNDLLNPKSSGGDDL
ncbi:hypothetical protein BJ741DRAFT_681397 [Chytriomyces cf. hyalinus JEL632]|nr:hypothetical protein BJ741DRAFT_681397 [Chytriomyces cf. hyalinus JEL632]